MAYTRKCFVCGEEKPATSRYFHRNNHHLNSTCRECRNQYMREHRRKLKELAADTNTHANKKEI